MEAKSKNATAPIESAKSMYDLATPPLTRSLVDVGLGRGAAYHLPRLRYTRREAEAIYAEVPPGSAMKALDFEANRATATSPELSRYRIVHFATHGLLNSEHPELSGLVLSLVDRNGRPQDGFLGLQDIYNLNLPADLVVLSACETGLGKEISGEGLVGTHTRLHVCRRFACCRQLVESVRCGHSHADGGILSLHGAGSPRSCRGSSPGSDKHVEAETLERSLLLGGFPDPG